MAARPKPPPAPVSEADPPGSVSEELAGDELVVGEEPAQGPPSDGTRPAADGGSLSGQDDSSSGVGSVQVQPTSAERRHRNATPPSLKAFELLGNYQILKRLGDGGMAEVYVARSTLGEGVDKLVAFKTVLPAYVPNTTFGAMFLTEARIGATLQHPNIAQVFDFGHAAGRPYMSMEYIHGRDLSELVWALRRQKRPAPVSFATSLALEVCKALEYVHEKKDLDGRPLSLVHRDVSPGNVLMSARSEVKLVDFGVAAAEGAIHQSGVLVGKLPFMTPEQASGEQPEASWDTFALGVILFQLLSLRKPYGNPTAAQLVNHELQDHRRPPSRVNPGVPKLLDELVMRATELEPGKRFASAGELRKALEEVQRAVGAGDVGALVREIFGAELSAEETEIEALMAEARRRSHSAGGAAIRRLWRRAASTRAGLWLARHPWAVRGAVAAVVLGMSGGAAAGWSVAATKAEVRERLAAADDRIRAGRLVGPGGDQALDHLLAAKKAAPKDPRVAARLKALADRFQLLGETALARGNPAEAGAHLQAALQADPSRTELLAKLQTVEELLKQESAARVQRGE